MYCQNCGKKLESDVILCPDCGHSIGERKEPKTYDYLTVNVKDRTAQLVLDVYDNLGWKQVSKGFNTINFKREHSILNKNQLLKLQNKLDNSIHNVEKLEISKTKSGHTIGLIITIIGLLIFGSGLAFCLSYENYIVGGILSSVGIIICAPAYSIVKAVNNKNTNKAIPLIEQAYDKIALLCEDAKKLM